MIMKVVGSLSHDERARRRRDRRDRASLKRSELEGCRPANHRSQQLPVWCWRPSRHTSSHACARYVQTIAIQSLQLMLD